MQFNFEDYMRQRNFSADEMGFIFDIESAAVKRITYLTQKSESMMVAYDVFGADNWNNEYWTDVLCSLIDTFSDSNVAMVASRMSEYVTAVIDKCLQMMVASDLVHPNNESHDAIREALFGMMRQSTPMRHQSGMGSGPMNRRMGGQVRGQGYNRGSTFDPNGGGFNRGGGGGARMRSIRDHQQNGMQQGQQRQFGSRPPMGRQMQPKPQTQSMPSRHSPRAQQIEKVLVDDVQVNEEQREEHRNEIYHRIINAEKDIKMDQAKLKQFLDNNNFSRQQSDIADVLAEDGVEADQNVGDVIVAGNEDEILAAVEDTNDIICGVVSTIIPIDVEAKKQIVTVFGQDAMSTEVQLLTALETLNDHPSVKRTIYRKMKGVSRRLTEMFYGVSYENFDALIKDAIQNSVDNTETEQKRTQCRNTLDVMGNQLRCIASDDITSFIANTTRWQQLVANTRQWRSVENAINIWNQGELADQLPVPDLLCITETKLYLNIDTDLSEVITGDMPHLIDAISAPTLSAILHRMKEANNAFEDKGIPAADEFILIDINGCMYSVMNSIDAESDFIPIARKIS